MLDYRNILRVAADPHKSMRTMELELRSSHHTIRKVLDAAGKAGIGWPLAESVTNEMLMELLFVYSACAATLTQTFRHGVTGF